MLNIDDRIYGKIKIEDPLIIELIENPSFQRLLNINQYGGVNFIFKEYQTTRYEHSIGVWWILKNLGVPLEIQVNGLLHDIAHSAFSHMVDMARNDANENYHENQMKKHTLMKPLIKILKKHNIKLMDPDKISEIKRDLPDVGADRIDYAIRDYYASVNKQTLFGKHVLKNIYLNDHKIVFNNINIARKYSLVGLKAMWNVIYDPKVAVVYQSIIEMLRTGLTEKWITEDDLFRDDMHLLKIFKKHKNKFPDIYIRIFEKPYKAQIVQKNAKYDFFHIKLKARYFDPLVSWDNKVLHLSECDNEFKVKLAKDVQKFEERKSGIFIKVNFTTNR
jgi:uncharacterized protein